MTSASAAGTAEPVESLAATSAAEKHRFAWLSRSTPRPPRRDAGDRERERAYTLAICFVTLIGLGLRLVFASGPVGSDDRFYFQAARMIVHDGRVTMFDHSASRLAFLLIVGGPGALAGSLYVCAFVNILISTATQVVATIFAYRAVSPRAGLITAIVLAFDGLPISYAGGLFPDDLLSLAALSCAIATFYAVRSDGARSAQLVVLAGAAAAFAYSVKDTGILLVPPVVLFILVWGEFSVRRRIALVAAFLLAFVALWAAEGTFYLARAGDFFYRAHTIAQVHNAQIGPSAGLKDFVRRGWWNLAITADSVWMMVVPLCVGTVAWLALLRRRDETTLFALIGGFVAIYLFFGSSSLTRFVNLPFQERYLVPVAPFVALALVIVLERLTWLSSRGEAMALGVLGAVCFAAGTGEAAQRGGTLYFAEALRNAAIAASSLPQDGRPIYASTRTREELGVVLPPETLARLKPWGSAGASPGYYLVLMRDGHPLWPDSGLTTLDALGSAYLSAGRSQRRASAWFAVPRRPARDSAVIYAVGSR